MEFDSYFKMKGLPRNFLHGIWSFNKEAYVNDSSSHFVLDQLKRILSSQKTLTSLAIIVNIVQMVVFYSMGKNQDVKASAAICLALEVNLLALLILGKIKENDEKWKRKKLRRLLFLFYKNCVMTALLIATISKIVYAAEGGIENPFSADSSDYIKELNFSERNGLLCIQIISIVFDCVVLTACWLLKGKLNLLLCCIALCLDLTLGLVNIFACIQIFGKMDPSWYRIIFYYVLVDSLLLSGSFLGLSLIMVISNRNRRSETIVKLVILIMLYYILFTLLEFSKFIMTLYYYSRREQSYFSELSIAYGCTLIVSIFTIICLHFLATTSSPKLLVEEIDLQELRDAAKKGFSRLIDANSKLHPGISGLDAINLMEAYSLSHIDGVEFKVLRVHRPEASEKTPASDTYEQYKPWRNIDEDDYSSIFDDSEKNIQDYLLKLVRPLSKNQLKRLGKKKNKKMNEESNSPLLDSLTSDSETQTQEPDKFLAYMNATEALVLLTRVKNYDLTNPLKGSVGSFIRRAFGEGSLTKLCCVDFGLIGFHWPFRSSTLYCSLTRHPVARSAAVKLALSKWNKSLPYRERCSVLIEPVEKNSLSSKAIDFAGWASVSVPRGNVIDLSPFVSKSAQEFFKAVKYRIHSDTFYREGGWIDERFDFTEDECGTVMDLWSNIAASHEESGRTSYLVNPNKEFLKSLGSSCSLEHRTLSLLYLKIGDESIASCVVFRIGDVITSDIQGLLLNKGRYYKAYFVMMEVIVQMALKEGKRYVDFGPTTDKPKADIGCKNVPLVGALDTLSPVLKLIAKHAAGKVNV